MSHMPTPTEAHKKLHRLAGTFRSEETMHPSPWNPAGGPATSRAENRIGVDGFNLIHDYRQTRDATVTFTGHGVFSYLPQSDEYTLHWFDSMNLPPNVFRGNFQGDVLTLTDDTAQMKHRCIFDLSNPDHYTSRMDVSQDGSTWTTFVEGRYTRAQ